ncbi:peptidylprolyl isomerase [bacterium]|nr:peptidylprolyl isomerase [bacterium]
MTRKWTGLTGLIIWLGLIPGLLLAKEIDRVLAVVNDEIITLSELEDRKQKLIAEMTHMVNPGELNAKIEEVEEQTLQMMIEEMLILQKANEMGLEIDEQAVNNALDNVMSANKLTSREELDQALRTEGMSLEEYTDLIKNQLKIFRVQNYEIKSKVRIIESELQDFYQAHPDFYIEKKQYHVRHILVQITSLRSDAETRQQAELIYQKLEDGLDFCTLAQELSDDPTGQDCGDLGTIEENALLPEFVTTLASLKPSQYSRPFQTRFGYHIVQLIEIIGGAQLPFEEVKDQIKDNLFEQKFFIKRAEWLEELKKTNFIKIIDQQETSQTAE